MTTQSEGYFTRGMPFVDGSKLSGASGIPVDTALDNGQTPQSGAIIPGTLPAPGSNIEVEAHVGGGQADATQLDYGVATVFPVNSANDSVKLPYAFPGAVCVLVNEDGSNSMQVFGRGTDTINSVATATGVAQAAAKNAIYVGTAGSGDGSDAGNWVQVLTA